MDLSDIGKQICQRRVSKSWRQEDLAEKTHLGSSYIEMIEHGEKSPKLETFIIITNALEVSADELSCYGYQVKFLQYTEK